MCDATVLKGAMKVSEAPHADPAPRDAEAEVAGKQQPSGDELRLLGRIEAQAGKFSKPNGKLKLVRSLAVCEESPPLLSPEPAMVPQPCDEEDAITKVEGEVENRCEKADIMDKGQKKTLSRDSSQDYTDSTGIDLHEFLVNTLKNNPRDRIMLLKLEQDILDFISNNESQKRKFPPMTSYHRMLLHRVAAYFGMEHNVDPSGKSVVINKTPNTRIPEQKFSVHIRDDRPDDFQKCYILKRDKASFDCEDGGSTGAYFNLDRRLKDEEVPMSTQQRRQIFRLRAGRSGNSWQSSSENEAPGRRGELRPWSSTDSSDSSHRVAPRPLITKASSYGGTATGLLVRGDSTASSGKSTAPLSKTGSGSSSSVASSSSSSLSRPQLPLVAPAPSRANVAPRTPVPQPATDTRASPGHSGRPQCGPTPAAVANASFCLLPLDAPGLPATGMLLHPHTGQPFVGPDSGAVVYNTPAPPAPNISTLGPPQSKTPHQPPPVVPTQQQPANHFFSQPHCPPFHPPPPPFHYVAASSQPPPPPLLPSSAFLAVCPNQQYPLPDALSAQFSHVSLVRQPLDGTGVPDAQPCTPFYHPSQLVLQGPPPQHLAGYVVATGNPGMQQGQPYSGTTPGPCPGPPLAQPHLQHHQQQHSYVQQPLQQVSCYCVPTPYAHCTTQQHQPCHPGPPVAYNCPQAPNLHPQPVYQTMVPSSAPVCPPAMGVPQTSSPALGCGQQSNMGNQMQGMMAQYSPIASYQQVSMPPETQAFPQQQYQQPPLGASCASTQAAMPVSPMTPCYGYSLLQPAQHTAMSSSLSYFPPTAVEQMSYPQVPASCVSQQPLGQQCLGVHPQPPTSGVLMMQVTVPPADPPCNHTLCQRKPIHREPMPEFQRSHRPMERCSRDLNTQSSIQTGGPGPPAQCSSPGLVGALSGLSTIPLVPHHQLPPAFCPGPSGEAHYSLLSQPLHYKTSMRPPLFHPAHMMPTHQGVGRAGQGRRLNRKGLPSDRCAGDPASGPILEVTDLPEGISRSQARGLLGELWLSEHHSLPCGEEPAKGGERNTAGCKPPPGDLASSTYTILATFPSKCAAEKALLRHGAPLTAFKLRTSNRHRNEP